MSIRARHLHDQRLLDCYLAERGGEPLDPPAAEHLTDCADCAARYSSFTDFMDGVRAEANAEVDELFPAEDLRARQQQILRRLEQIGHTARVISFPGHSAAHHYTGRRSSLTLRWIAGAAAAGLLIGVYVGSGGLLDGPRWRPRSTEAGLARSGAPTMHIAEPAVLRAAPEPAAQALDTVETVQSDAYDRFLEELELAGDRPHTPELVALDDLTPHVRPLRAGLR